MVHDGEVKNGDRGITADKNHGWINVTFSIIATYFKLGWNPKMKELRNKNAFSGFW